MIKSQDKTHCDFQEDFQKCMMHALFRKSCILGVSEIPIQDMQGIRSVI